MSSRNLLDRLDDATLQELFSDATLQRGRAYVSRVRNLRQEGKRITAQVQGSASKPYTTSVKLELKDFYGKLTVQVSSRCSCPVGSRCKHAVAVLLAARQPSALRETPRPEVLQWAQTLGTRTATPHRKSARPASQELLYAIYCEGPRGRPELRIYKSRAGGSGEQARRGTPWFNVDQALLRPPTFVQDSDLPALRLFRDLARRQTSAAEVSFTGNEGWSLLQAVLETGRAWIARTESQPLQFLERGPERQASLNWITESAGTRAVLVTEPAGHVLPTQPLTYLDAERRQAGLARAAEPAALLALLELPPLRPCELPLVGAALQAHAPTLPAPPTRPAAVLREIDLTPQPVLHLSTLHVWEIRAHRQYPGRIGADYDCALPLFRYGEIALPPGSDTTLATLKDGTPVRIRRHPEEEAEAMRALARFGLQPVHKDWLSSYYQEIPAGLYGLASEEDWDYFFAEAAPALRAAGWKIEWEDGFRHYYATVDEWYAELDEDAAGWLDLSLGVEVEGRRLDLAPLLHTLFRLDPRWLAPQTLEAIPDDESVPLEAPDGLHLRVPAERIKPLAKLLMDLFAGSADDAPLRLSPLDAPRLAEAVGSDWQRQGFATLDGWLERLRGIESVQPVPTPEGFRAELRPYQREGLAWLQHLAAHGLGGILADDMGLGKTAQALAHILVEKRAGRLDRPALVVLPTSLVFNWAREAARFAPELRVLKLHGKERAERFDEIPEHDVCLTTYPLLWRDRAELAVHEWHLLILDEAQNVKNASSQSARAVRALSARHRLCITGTPLENNLGELWAQFDFLLPGFLGDSRDFARLWRTPIEKHGDTQRQDLLARRIAPFVLRRRKEDVATELPPKAVMLRSVDITGRQRDLYETVRAAMDQQVRAAIAAQGFARSHIQILDALLRLRQVCCDPRLLKTPAAAKVKERAKLDLLMEMLPSLIAEGRRILLFSQFTEMLALIEEELDAAKIPYALLTGQTRDREAVVERFQRGDVPVFLISLKAGGVGLNLTAADTVIHYDPWWNPAAENQATDRAHRIGQTHQVFVYKLVVAGSIEEKILALQERKASLAAGVLAEDHEGSEKFGEEDLRALFEPLPEEH